MRMDCKKMGRSGFGRRVAGMIVGGVLVCVSAGGLGGCNNELKDKNAALLQENQELRDRNTQLEQSVSTADARGATDPMRDSGPGARAPRAQGNKAKWEDEYGVKVTGRGNDVVVAVAGDVLFDSGKATLKATAKKTLDKIAANLKGQYGGKRIRVEGYTDTDPIKKSQFPSNEALSKERASVVENYLVSKGVSSRAISAVGMGSSNPKSTKKDSRRVEIVILDSRGID